MNKHPSIGFNNLFIWGFLLIKSLQYGAQRRNWTSSGHLNCAGRTKHSTGLAEKHPAADGIPSLSADCPHIRFRPFRSKLGESPREMKRHCQRTAQGRPPQRMYPRILDRSPKRTAPAAFCGAPAALAYTNGDECGMQQKTTIHRSRLLGHKLYGEMTSLLAGVLTSRIQSQSTMLV